MRRKAEGEIFFRAGEGKVDDHLVDAAPVGHDGAKTLIESIADGGPGGNFYDARITALGETIRCHVVEEEMPSTVPFNRTR